MSGSSEMFFYLDKGKAAGPFAKQDIEDAIIRGRLGPFDMLYRDGEEEWLPVHQFTDFKSLFKSQIKVEIEETWVVLARKEGPSGVSYLQRGPFSPEKIKAMLDAGEIRYRDFIWREGQSQWTRISAVERFAPPPVVYEPPTLLPQDVNVEDTRTRTEILSEVVKVSKSQPLQPPIDEKPPEASTEDLSAIYSPEPSAALSPATNPSIPSPRGSTKIKGASTTTMPLNRARFPDLEKSAYFDVPKPKMFSSFRIAAGLGSLALLGFLYVNRHDIMKFSGIESAPVEVVEPIKPKPKVKEVAKNVAPEPAKPVVVAPTVAPTPAPPPPVVEPARVEPTRIKASVVDSVGAKPTLVFDTDGSYHFPIKALIVGQAGDILGAVSVFKEVTVRRSKEADNARLDLSSLDLGEGQYLVVATYKDVKEEFKFRIGKEDRDFKIKLDRHRKLISLPFQRERRRFILASKDLQSVAADFRQLSSAPEAGWKEGWRRWNETFAGWSKTQLDGLNLNNPKSLVFPRAWQYLMDVHGDLKRLSQETDKRRRAGGAVDGEEIRSVLERLRLLAEASQSLSLYR